MGNTWLTDLPEVVAAAGLRWRVWPGWETRGRSSGGYDAVRAVFVHHTASNTAPDNDCRYMWENSPDAPVGALLLDRTGLVTIGAAGATNCQGKGGPWPTSRGTIPADKGNVYGIAVEAANNGVGEPWPDAQTDAYTVLADALCHAYGLDTTRDVVAHFEWVSPPPTTGRKTDPAGPSPWAVGANQWDMDGFRCDAAGRDTNGDDDMTADQANQLDQVHTIMSGAFWPNRPDITDVQGGELATRIRNIESKLDAIAAKLG